MDCSPPGSSIHGIFQARVLSRWKLQRKDVCLWGHSEDCVLRDWSGPHSAIWKELPEKERTCEEMSAEIGLEVESVKVWQKWGYHLHIWILTCLKPAIFLGFWLTNFFFSLISIMKRKDSWPFVLNFICFLPVAFLACSFNGTFYCLYQKCWCFLQNLQVPGQCFLGCLSQVWCLAWGRDIQ